MRVNKCRLGIYSRGKLQQIYDEYEILVYDVRDITRRIIISLVSATKEYP